MKKLLSSLVVCSLFFLIGCNGSSGENTNPDNESPVASSISLQLVNSAGNNQQSYSHDEIITVHVTIKDQFNQVFSGSRVDFSADLGSLSLDSRLTDANGIAAVELANNTTALGAGTLSVTSGSLSSSIDYEFIQANPISQPSELVAEILFNGLVTNQFKANEQAQIEITLVDGNNQGIANSIVNISADIGLLSTGTALTNDNGKASVTLSGGDQIGAGVITVTLADDASLNYRLNYQVLPADSAILDDILIGHYNASNEFVEGEIALSIYNNTISAGGTLGLSVELVDSELNRISSPTTVTFTSNCVINERATIDQTVFSIKGHASATFEDINCAGISGTEDLIIASVTANGVTKTATVAINILGEQLGSIEFISAEPNSIVIKGSGGQETSTITFLLKSALGNPIAQQQVDFSLDSDIGGISLSRESGFTNSQGLITTQVSSGTVPTVVRVTASATMEENGETSQVQTQSSELSINTGLPEQSSMTIAATVLNPEADTRGEESTIRVWLADSFNNPVPDGTTVNFTTEGGTIEPSCNTVSGNCAVTWTATEPYLTDHRSTILATTSGHETFFDSNGDNVFDNNDGNAITNEYVDSGIGRQNPLSSGFVDMTEAWRDDNENRVKDASETKFFDINGNGKFDVADGKFNGPQCAGDKCDENAKKATLRKSLILIMSSANNPNYVLSNSSQTYTYEDSDSINRTLPNVGDGNSLALNFRFADSQMQTMPIGTTVNVSLEGGELQGTTSIEIGNTAASGYRSLDFVINNPVGGVSEQATLTITIDTPNTLPITYINKTLTLL